MLAVLQLGVLLGAQTAAHEALLVPLLCVLAGNGKLVQTLSVAGAVVGCRDTGAVRGEAAQVHLVGGCGGTGAVGEVDASATRGEGDLVDLGVGDGGLDESAAEITGGLGGPVSVFGGAGGLRNQDQSSFESARGDGLDKGGKTVDEGLECMGVLSRVSTDGLDILVRKLIVNHTLAISYFTTRDMPFQQLS